MKRIKRFLFLNTGTKQTIAKNTIWLIIGEIISRILRFFVVVYAARTLNTTGWGTFSYALSIGSLFMVFSDIGISGYVTRELTQKNENSKKIVSTALFIKSIILVISTLFIIIIGPHITKIKEAVSLLPVIALILFFDSLRELGLAINRAYEKMEWDAAVKILTSVIMFICSFILLKKNINPNSLAIVYLLGSLSGCLFIYLVLYKKLFNMPWQIDKTMILSILITVFPFAFTSLLGSIMSNTDVYMLGLWRTSSEIGLYSASQRLYQFFLVIPSILSMVIFPVLSKLNEINPDKFITTLEKTLKITILAAIPIAFGGIIIAKEIIILTLGHDYIQAIPIFQVLMAMILIAFPSIIISNAIFAKNKQKIFLKSSTLGAISNILLNLFFIPLFGVIGAGISTLIALTISTAFMWFEMKKILKFEIFYKIKKPIIAGIIMLIICFLLKINNIYYIYNIILSALTYCITLYFLKDESIDELKKLYQTTF